MTRWWQPPLLPDLVARRRAATLYSLVSPLLLLLIVLTASLWLPGSSVAPGISTGICAALALLLFGSLLLARFGAVEVGIVVAVGSLVLATTLATASFGGISGMVAMSLLLPIPLAGALRGWPAALGTGVAAAVGSGVVFLLEHAGIAPFVSTPLVPLGSWLGFLAFSAMYVIFLVAFARSLQAAQQEAAETRRRGAELRQTVAARMSEAQRLESLGRLAGGVAHDFRNLLTAIVSNAELARLDGRDERCREELDQILAAAERASDLTGQLLAFARREIVQPRVLQLNSVVRELEPMLRTVVRDDVDMCLELHGDLGNVCADRGQLEQVVVNLIANANDAMPEGGKLTVESMNVEVEEEGTQAGSAPPGRYVLLAVTDSGEGMSETVREKIFDPFFTTKQDGSGTGLGLATVHGIVSQAGGHITVYSEPGRGSVFKVYLPRVDDAVVPVVAESTAPVELPTGLTILVADDEDLVRMAVSKVLSSRGIQVLEAADGHAALAAAAAHDGGIDLLITDVVMPGIVGGTLAEKLREKRPAIRVLYVSGYTENSIAHGGVLDEGIHFLAKPFAPDALLARIGEVLSSER